VSLQWIKYRYEFYKTQAEPQKIAQFTSDATSLAPKLAKYTL